MAPFRADHLAVLALLPVAATVVFHSCVSSWHHSGQTTLPSLHSSQSQPLHPLRLQAHFVPHPSESLLHQFGQFGTISGVIVTALDTISGVNSTAGRFPAFADACHSVLSFADACHTVCPAAFITACAANVAAAAACAVIACNTASCIAQSCRGATAS